jgi:hypothetical protein
VTLAATTSAITTIFEITTRSITTNLTYTKRHKGPKVSEYTHYSDVPLYPRFQHIKRVLDWVQIRRIWREILELDASVLTQLGYQI